MLKTLLHRFLGAGRIPRNVLPALQAEGIEILEEGIWGTITYRNFRAPGRYSNWKRQWFLGALALTSKRVACYNWTRQLINIPYDHPNLAEVKFTLEPPETLCISFDVSRFHDNQSGTIEIRYTTPKANHILDLLKQRGGG